VIHRLAAALALVAIGISVSTAAAPVLSASWHDGPCTDNVGITVVIDFQELDPGVANVRCVPAAVTSGLDALTQAGIAWEGTSRFPGLVCRIAGKPGTNTEPCVNAPPLSAYWEYWIAPRGGQWCFSNVGAGSRTPPPGSTEGWSFALNRTSSDTPPPRFQPPAAIDGDPPHPLSGGDCGTAASQTTSTTVQPADSSTTVAIATPQPPVAPAPTTIASAVVTATTLPKPVGGATTTTSVATTVTTIAAAIGSSTTIGSTIDSDTTNVTAGALVAAAPTTLSLAVGSTVPLGTVDLGDDGRGGSGFGVATVIGIVAAASLVGAGVWAARRRRVMP
jgi:hypothetical protein